MAVTSTIARIIAISRVDAPATIETVRARAPSAASGSLLGPMASALILLALGVLLGSLGAILLARQRRRGSAEQAERERMRVCDELKS